MKQIHLIALKYLPMLMFAKGFFALLSRASYVVAT